MICKNCSHDNPEGSIFCEECGKKLHQATKSTTHSNHAIADEIDDVIFVPRKKSHTVRNIIIAIVLFTLAIGIGSIVIEAFRSYSDTTSIEKQADGFPLYDLSLVDTDLTWIGERLYLKGILKNSYTSGAKNVNVRVDLYRDAEATQLFDTRFITILGVSSEGAYSFEEEVLAQPEGDFWWRANIDSADFL